MNLNNRKWKEFNLKDTYDIFNIKNLFNNNLLLQNREWKEFKLNYFFQILLSTGDNQANLLEDGKLPLISAGTINNGICKFVKNGDGISKIFQANSITIDMFGKVFYQNYNFYAVSHGRINILLPTFISNKYINLFFCSIIENRFKNKYSFAFMCNKKRLEREKISIPINSKGEPDYEFMENYIKNITIKKYNNYLKYIENAK